MKDPRRYLSKLSGKLDLPVHIAAQLPYITIDGYRKVSIDMQKGLLSYSDTEIVVAVPMGEISVQGNNLKICLMKEGKIIIDGEPSAVLLRMEGEK